MFGYLRLFTVPLLCCFASFQSDVLAGKPIASTKQQCFQLRTRIKTSAWVEGIYFSPDGRLVTQRGRKKLKAWDALTGQLYREYTGNDSRTSAVGFSRDGSRIAAGDTGSMAWVWDVADGRLLARFRTKHYDEVSEIVLSPDGRLLATMGAGGSLWSSKGNTKVKLWDVDAQRLRADLTLPNLEDGIFTALAFSPNGKTLVAAFNEQAGLWDPTTSELRTQLVGPDEDDRKMLSHGYNALRDLAFSPDGRLLATLSFYGGSVDLWDGRTGKFLAHLGNGIRSLTFSPDAKLLALGGFRNTVTIYDLGAGKVVNTFQGEQGKSIHHVSFSADGRMLAGSDDKNTGVWEVAHGQLKQKLLKATQATFSPDGRTLATYYDNHLSLWDVSCR